MNKLQQLQNDLATARVLYVEDEEEVRIMTLTFFNNIFTHVDSAANGEEGLELFKKKPYALVITDLNMPKIDGREMLKQIRELDKDTVLIIMTASDSNIDASEIVCDAYMNKPVRFLEFIETLEPLKEKILRKAAKSETKELP
ncbi:MAG: response regulator [Sulfurimonas sp.]|nr:response regulator [Sulfurimonas sp.]MBU1217052.1 response regulator [bacterium]MBU1435389.1 response regulator [bacterium]MBU1502300.1 response regulator [bacterium]MBU3940240.1 response regulator [bacterium]